MQAKGSDSFISFNTDVISAKVLCSVLDSAFQERHGCTEKSQMKSNNSDYRSRKNMSYKERVDELGLCSLKIRQ